MAKREDRRRRHREHLSARPETSDMTPAEALQRAELHRELVNTLLDLKEPYRTTVVLRFFEALTPDEIACRQAVPVSTVRTRLRRGLMILRTTLDERLGGRQL